jgi:CDP-diacylglycerol---glycerol-3-phosphate 3-phosphatidyltransferase
VHLDGARLREGRRAAGPCALESGVYPLAMASRAAAGPLAHVPNALTLLRLLLIPVYVALMLLVAEDGYSWAAAIVFAAAGITDQLDGWLARRWHVESSFGRIADPLADRLMIDAAVVMLWLQGRLPWPALAVILARDVLLVVGYKVLVPRGLDLSVNFLGKLATWILYASLALMMVTRAGTALPLWLFWGGLALALVAGLEYAVTAARRLRT